MFNFNEYYLLPLKVKRALRIRLDLLINNMVE